MNKQVRVLKLQVISYSVIEKAKNISQQETEKQENQQKE